MALISKDLYVWYHPLAGLTVPPAPALIRRADSDAIGQAAYSAGKTLAEIGRIMFSNSGWLSPGPAVTLPPIEGPDPIPRFQEMCLESPNLQLRMPVDLRDRTHAVVWSVSLRQACVISRDAI